MRDRGGIHDPDTQSGLFHPNWPDKIQPPSHAVLADRQQQRHRIAPNADEGTDLDEACTARSKPGHDLHDRVIDVAVGRPRWLGQGKIVPR